MRQYDDVMDLARAITSGEVDPTTLTGFICKRELFIRAGTPEDVFSQYYGSRNACEDVCRLLGIEDVVDV